MEEEPGLQAIRVVPITVVLVLVALVVPVLVLLLVRVLVLLEGGRRAGSGKESDHCERGLHINTPGLTSVLGAQGRTHSRQQ
jgi:hypothetical protein